MFYQAYNCALQVSTAVVPIFMPCGVPPLVKVVEMNVADFSISNLSIGTSLFL